MLAGFVRLTSKSVLRIVKVAFTGVVPKALCGEGDAQATRFWTKGADREMHVKGVNNRAPYISP